MIKSILNDDETEPKKRKSEKSSVEKISFNPTPAATEKVENQDLRPTEDKQKPKASDDQADLGVSRDDVTESAPVLASKESELEKRLNDIKAELAELQKNPQKSDEAGERGESGDPVSTEVSDRAPDSISISVPNQNHADTATEPEPFSDSPAESMRKSGLAYSAAIALFGSVIFMLILGWFADLLLGIRPWGTVIGIALGSVIGFFQFFSITSRIFAPKQSDFERVSLVAQDPPDAHRSGTDDSQTSVDSNPAEVNSSNEVKDPETPRNDDDKVGSKDTPASL